MDTFKKVLKILGIILIIAGAAAGIYLAVTKYLEKKKKPAVKKAADFISMDSFEDDFISETVFDEEEDEPFLKDADVTAE